MRKPLLTPTSTSYSISKRIELKHDCSGFLERRLIAKDVIKSFYDMERLMLIKDKLIKFAIHHINIFGELESISTNSQSFMFNFKYTPSITLRELTSLNLNHAQINTLIDKVWLFIGSLRSNGF